jgi:hypothetical protein
VTAQPSKYRFLLINAFSLAPGNDFQMRSFTGPKETQIYNYEDLKPFLADIDWDLNPGAPATHGNWPVTTKQAFMSVGNNWLPLVSEACGKYNAIVLLGGGDPGVTEAREIGQRYNIPVTGCASPAGTMATVWGATGLSYTLTDGENGTLNPRGLNCLRTFPIFGTISWGARTGNGADAMADEYKYVPIRRLALFLEESLYRGSQWAVFEPNDEPLWAQLRLNIGAFMHTLFAQGAFQGQTPRDAYFVKCDKETTTQNDVDLGRVNIVVGFAPLKPAEFVIIQIQQIAGNIRT